MKVMFQGRRIELADPVPFVPSVDLLLVGVPATLQDRVKAMAAAGPICGVQITNPSDRKTWKVCVARHATARQRRDIVTALGLTAATADLVEVERAEERPRR